jgi:hypothetical protein
MPSGKTMLPSPASFEGLDTPSAWYDPLRPHQHLYQQTPHLAERRGFQVVFRGNIWCCTTDWSIQVLRWLAYIPGWLSGGPMGDRGALRNVILETRRFILERVLGQRLDLDSLNSYCLLHTRLKSYMILCRCASTVVAIHADIHRTRLGFPVFIF